jgi:hypothetical protein
MIRLFQTFYQLPLIRVGRLSLRGSFVFVSVLGLIGCSPVTKESTKKQATQQPKVPSSDKTASSPSTLATITATPNPVPRTKGPGKTMITWNTGDGSPGQVYVSTNGGPEQLFADGLGEGSNEAPWIGDATFEFRLYSARKTDKKLLASVQVKLGHSITADPNPVPGGSEMGKTTISWFTADGSLGQVYVSANGAPEQLFADVSAQGSNEAPWISVGTFEFRLYEGNEHKKVLAAVKVTRSEK